MYSEACPLSHGHCDHVVIDILSLVPGTFHLEGLMADPCFTGQMQVGRKPVSEAGPELSFSQSLLWEKMSLGTMGLRGRKPRDWKYQSTSSP